MEAVMIVVVLWMSVILFHDHALVEGQGNTSFIFPSFPADDGSVLKVDDVIYNATLESYDLNRRGYMTGLLDQECGRLLYKDKVRMFDRKSQRSASFNTSFTFAFLQPTVDSTYCGAGMAFSFVAGTSFTETEYLRKGKGMCVFDYADRNESNRVLTVKFDSALTNVQGFNDPSDSNIGVIISRRGMTTEHTYNLCPNNTTRCSFFCGPRGDNFSAWIDYDSVSLTLEVRFRNGSLGAKPVSPVIRVTDLRLDGSMLENEEMYVGFSGSTFWSREMHRIRAWSFNSTAVPKSSHKPPILAIVGITFGAIFGAALMGIVVAFLVWHTKSSRSFSSQQKYLSFSNNAPRAFKYRELRRATKNFSSSQLLSGGSFGDVYKGTLPSGVPVAVKRIRNNKEQGEESFLAEATSLRQIRHRNLMQLRGWCQAKEGLLLVYDYLSNGSLDKWLHKSKHLTWNVRRFIMAGVAAGLAYLHEEWVQCILHRDIKSSNVMLDANFNAYLGDFGLARLVDHQKLEKTTLLAGTIGYMAPEMQYTGRATKETDVFAFGILLLEVVCGRRPLATTDDDAVLLDCVWRAHEAGNMLTMADPKLQVLQSEETTRKGLHEENEMIEMSLHNEKTMIASTLQLGLLCCLPNPTDRPSMRMVNQWFQSTIDLPPLPPVRPYSQYSDVYSGLKSSASPSNVSSFQTWASSGSPESGSSVL